MAIRSFASDLNLNSKKYSVQSFSVQPSPGTRSIEEPTASTTLAFGVTGMLQSFAACFENVAPGSRSTTVHLPTLASITLRPNRELGADRRGLFQHNRRKPVVTGASALRPLSARLRHFDTNQRQAFSD